MLSRKSQQAAHEEDLGDGLLPVPGVGHHGDDGRANQKLGWTFPIPKLEFPLFYGVDPKKWVRDCEKFFDVFHIRDDQRIRIVVIHLIGTAESSYQSAYVKGGFEIIEVFRDKICDKFGKELAEDVGEKFNQLRQTRTIEFLVELQIMKAQTLIRNPTLIESHFVSNFIRSLNDEIKMTVKLFKPQT